MKNHPSASCRIAMTTMMLVSFWISFYLLAPVAIPTTEAFQVRRHSHSCHTHLTTTNSCLYGKKKKNQGGGGSRQPQYQEKQSVKEARFGK